MRGTSTGQIYNSVDLSYPPEGNVLTALEFGDDGALYTAAAARDSLFGHVFTVDIVDGIATDLGSAGMDEGPVALTFFDETIFTDGFESGDTSAWSSTTP